MRAHEHEKAFAEWLLQLGNGQLNLTNADLPQNSILIPNECNIITGNLEDVVFEDLSSESAQTVIICPTNDHTLHLNNKILDKLPGETRVYLSMDKAICDESEGPNYPIEFLNSITPTGMPPHCLKLKKNAIIMLLRNLDIKRGLCNGTRLILKHMHEHVLDAEVLTGPNSGERVLIPRIRLAPSDVALPFTLQRTQFPIRLAYCMTINKSQGQTFNRLGIYLPTPVFSHGQLYVAFSRTRSFKDIFIKVEPTNSQGHFGQHLYTQNIVYTEVL